MAYANLPQWAFLHRWRALPETFVHFLMFIDTFKSFSLTFYYLVLCLGPRALVVWMWLLHINLLLPVMHKHFLDDLVSVFTFPWNKIVKGSLHRNIASEIDVYYHLLFVYRKKSSYTGRWRCQMTRSDDELEHFTISEKIRNGGGADRQFVCARFGPRGKSRPLQGLLEFRKKNWSSHVCFRNNWPWISTKKMLKSAFFFWKKKEKIFLHRFP